MLNKVIPIAKEAGKILLRYYKKELNIHLKKDESPVTQADLAADKYIRKALQKAFPEDQMITEESKTGCSDFSGRVWIVDPLDGTRAFIRKEDGFCVLMGLCVDAIPVLGVAYIPARGELYYAEKGKGAFAEKNGKKIKLQVSKVKNISQAKLVMKRSVGVRGIKVTPFLSRLPFKKRFYDSSFGSRICQIVSGNADLYLCENLGLSKWDTCASQVILEEAGGRMTFIDGKSIDYDHPSSSWQEYVLSSNGLLHDTMLAKLKKYVGKK